MNSTRYGVCTIAAKNYASHVRTLFYSLREHQPKIRCWALIVDDWKGFLDPAREPFEVVSLADLDIPNVINMTFQYDVMEFSTAVKPFLLEHLLTNTGLDRLIYLDPDILVTGSLDKLFGNIDQADYCVTPHLDTDYPDDALLPNDAYILRCGIFNLGFFGLRRSAQSTLFLRWWQHKMKNKCVNNQAAGYFVDQRFIDLATSFFSNYFIERGVGYNMAYWNMHSRRLSAESGRWMCNGGPLHFFHFSGYSPDQPHLISKYMTRYTLIDRPDVKPLFEYYARRLKENQYDESRRWPYSFGCFQDGDAIPYSTRVRYRAALEGGIEIPDPFRSSEKLEKALAAIERDKGYSIKDAARDFTPPVLWNLLKRLKRSFVI